MEKSTVTRAYLSDVIHKELGFSKDDSLKLIGFVLESVGDYLLAGHTVKLSSFGSFSIRQKKERMGRNPKSGEEALIDKRKVVLFHASQILKDKLNSKKV